MSRAPIRPLARSLVVMLAVTLAGDRMPAQAPATPTHAGGSPPGGAAVAGGAAAEGRGRVLSPRNANYSIDARLDPATRTITGRSILTWRNITSRPTSELRLHLYWNAWKNSRSTFLREQALSGRGRAAATPGRRARPVPLEAYGYTSLTAVRLLGAGDAPPVDLTSRTHFIRPDDGNPDDETLARVPLPLEVAPGQTINVELEWTARVPHPFARTGVIGNYYFIAQWFPKVAVLEDTGWVAHQFHAATEFFADFGIYDVRLRVPTGWVVGATGRLVEARDNHDGTTTHRYVQEDVHDFAWTTSPDFLERHDVFDHPGLPRVGIRLLLQPEHAGQEPRYFAATRAALRHYGEWFGPYPYPQLTVVDPAWQSGSGGMEYPTLFTGGTRWLAPRTVSQPEGVTIHEAGHQFWYGLVATNEFEHAWMDEGLNTFSTGRVLDELMPVRHHSLRLFGGFVPWVTPEIRLSRATDANGLARYRIDAESDVPATPTWQYWPATAASISYSKTALWLHTLERMLGWETLQRALSTYFQRYRFRHPTPEDFFRVLNEVSGRDLTWFFDQVHRSSNTFDYGVARLVSTRKVVRGFVDRDGRKVAVGAEPIDNLFETTVVVRRHGEAIFPVDVVVRFEDGSEARERWDGRDRWKAFTFERPVAAREAEVDPERILLLDVNLTNNSLTLAPEAPRAATRWAVRWLVWLQDLLLTYAFFV